MKPVGRDDFPGADDTSTITTRLLEQHRCNLSQKQGVRYLQIAAIKTTPERGEFPLCSHLRVHLVGREAGGDQPKCESS